MSDQKENATVNSTRAIFAKAGITKPQAPQPTAPSATIQTQEQPKGNGSSFNPANLFGSQQNSSVLSRSIISPIAQPQPKIPTRSETEFKTLSPLDFIVQELQSKFTFDPSMLSPQMVKIAEISGAYGTTLNIGKGVVHILQDNKHVGDMGLDQLYSQLFKSNLMEDHQTFDQLQEANYQAKYLAPTAQALSNVFTPTLNDLPDNMQPQYQGATGLAAQETNDQGEVDQMPTQAKKRGRKPKDLFNAPDGVEASIPEAPQQQTKAILQDIASSSAGSTRNVLEVIKENVDKVAVEAAKMVTKQVSQQLGAVDAKDLSLEKFRISDRFIAGISIIVEEFAKHIVALSQGKQDNS